MSWPGSRLDDVVIRPDGTRVETTYEWNNGAPYVSHQTIETLDGGRTDMSFDATGAATNIEIGTSDSAVVTHNDDGTMTVDNLAANGIRHVGLYDASGHLIIETATAPNGDIGVTLHNPDGTISHTGVFHGADRFGNEIPTTSPTTAASPRPTPSVRASSTSTRPDT